MNNTNNTMNIEDVWEIVSNTAVSTKEIASMLGVASSKLKQLELDRRRDSEKLDSLASEFEAYKELQKQKEYIDPADVFALRQTIENRVTDILKQNNINFKYYGKYMSKCWRDVKKFAHVLGRGGVYTRKMYFNDAIEYIGTWVPHGYGVMGYKNHLDVLAEERG